MLRNLARRLPKSHIFKAATKRISCDRSSPSKQRSLQPAALLFGTILYQFEDKNEPENIKQDDLDDLEVNISMWSENESSIMNLMNLLKDSIIGASLEYRNCLQKQIEITNTASQFGHFSERWDEMPEYRVLADELRQELDKYLVLIKTVGKLASDKSFVTILPRPEESVASITVRFMQLEAIVNREVEANQKMEQELLRAKRDSILKMAS